MTRLGKIIIVSLLVLTFTVGSFIAGMFFQARMSNPALASVSMTSLGLGKEEPEAVGGMTPSEFHTFWEAWSFLDKQFYGDIPQDSDRVYGAIRGMVESFDDQHTAFIDPVRAAVSSENISGSFEGIGASIRMDESGRLVVAHPFPERPAFKAGVRTDDIILEVDGDSVEGLNLYEAVLLIRGPAGSTVTLTIFREGTPEPFDIPIERAKIEIEVVQSELMEGNIGYIRLTQFSKGAAEKITEAIEELFEQGATALIFDLRSNPGGLLSESVNVSSLFLEEGTVVIERLKNDKEKRFDVERGLQVSTGEPLVVLVNGGSASASEIVAGAIQDLERGTIIGEQTFGKGSVQLPHTLSDGSQLRVTVAEWLTPGGRQIHGEGISPDVTVEMTLEDFEQGLDPQLDGAVEFLNRTVANQNE